MLAKKFLSVFVIVFLLLSYIPLSAQDDLIIVLDPGHGATDNGSSGKLNGKTYYEKDLNKYLGQVIEFVVTEYNAKRRRIIGDRKQLLVAKKKDLQKNLKCSKIKYIVLRRF